MFLFRHIFLTIFVFALTEVVVLSQVSDLIGWGWTILCVVATAMLGSALLRHQGFDTWMRINERLQKGEMPGAELIEGVMLLIGGALLITPGFITDGVGFMCLLPTTRKAFARWAMAKGVMEAMAKRGGAGGNVWTYQARSSSVDAGGYEAVDIDIRGFGANSGLGSNAGPGSSSSHSSSHVTLDAGRPTGGNVIEGEVIKKDD